MKIRLFFLLVLDAILSGEAEIRHHQVDKHHLIRENHTTLPWATTSLLAQLARKVSVDDSILGEIQEIGDRRQTKTWTINERNYFDFDGYKRIGRNDSIYTATSIDSFEENFTTKSSHIGAKEKNENKAKEISKATDTGRKSIESQMKINFSDWKPKMESRVEFFDLKKRIEAREFPMTRPIAKSPEEVVSIIDIFGRIRSSSLSSDDSNYYSNYESSTLSQFENGKVSKNLKEWTKGESERFQNLNRDILNLEFAEPSLLIGAKEDVPKAAENCTETILRDFDVNDEVVDESVLRSKEAVKKMTDEIADGKINLERISVASEHIMKKQLTIQSIFVNAFESFGSSQMSQTIYRKGNDLLIDKRSTDQWKLFKSDGEAWTRVFKNCLTDSWNFGYNFRIEKEGIRIDGIVFFSIDHISGTVDQCNPNFREILNGGPKCDTATTKCLVVPRVGFVIGGYKCHCRDGYRLIESSENDRTSGYTIEKTFLTENFTQFRCFPCLNSCTGVCSDQKLCTSQRSQLLKNSVLTIQIICVLITSALTIVVLKHRKCKTIAAGMWTIMEMILLGSIILYASIIIRAFDPSTFVCLVEPWCREIGFVLCYGSIILKLYRILIEFRTRKAHRWVIRDKDLLKYLLGMVIVVFGYMAAWTATSLDLIQKENYTMLTTGTTVDGLPFKACKAAWWDYITEAGEILILVFGIHLSYASRNATTQFRERCFLCMAITTEAFVSGTFYIFRYFYWETEVHPDTSFFANFVRCQLTTTVVLLLLLAPKWWYQKVQVNKGRVPRNYLTQESGRGPLEAFKLQDRVAATNSDVEGEISLADMNPEDIRIELKRLYTQLEVLKNKTIRFNNPHISKRRGGRKIAHRRFSLQKKGSREKTLRQQTNRLSSKQTDFEFTEAEASRTPEDSVCSIEGPSIVINDGFSSETFPRKNQK